MIKQVTQSPDLPALQACIDRVQADTTVKSLLVLSCADNPISPDQWNRLIEEQTLPIHGGLFPGLIDDGRVLRAGHLVIGLPWTPVPLTIPLSGDASANSEAILEHNMEAMEPVRSMLVFVDGLCSGLTPLIDALFNVYGLELNYFGGGAGSLCFEQPVEVGVRHGWTTLAGPFRVTEVDGTTIHSLDWRPAFDVYAEILRRFAGKDITRENFFEYAKAHPFGIKKFDAEVVVRDPIAPGNNGSLACVGEIPRNALVDILQGDADSLTEAAGQATRDSLARERPEAMFCFDCISRVLFLEEDFDRELRTVARPPVPLAGALTIGEIANSGHDYLEFYNKTCVVASLRSR